MKTRLLLQVACVSIRPMGYSALTGLSASTVVDELVNHLELAGKPGGLFAIAEHQGYPLQHCGHFEWEPSEWRGVACAL